MSAAPVIVVGAGIGGLTAALALLRTGNAVVVLEQAPELAEIGAGVTLSPNAMRGYVYLALAEAIAAAGVEPSHQRVQHWCDGRTLLAFERGAKVRAQYGAPYVYIHRADLHSILAGAVLAAGGEIRTGAPVVAARALKECAVAELADGSEVRGPLLIGADGLKSVVRRLFETERPHFTGHVAWRALVPVTTPALKDMADFPGMHIGPGRMAVRYPVRGGTMLNLVFFARQTGWTEEGWTIPAQRSELESTFAEWCEEVQTLIAAAAKHNLFKWAVHARTALARWSIADRVVLLGDAAHAMTPFLGQGAACAIEDAVVLSRALACERSRGAGIARYEAARRERTSLIQRESNLNADRIQGDESDNFGLANLRNEETLGLFEYDAGSVAI
jgi:salicylate hydroxylase